MFHKLEHLSDSTNFLVIVPHADSAPGTCIHSVKKRFPCVTRVSRAIAAAMKRPVAPAAVARCIPSRGRKLLKERDRVNPT